MSQWTHINGSIRVDHLHGIEDDVDFEEILGTIISYDDEEEKWDMGTTLPMGSEGSLQYNIWKNPSKSQVAAFAINIWGDLRDFGNKDDIQFVRD